MHFFQHSTNNNGHKAELYITIHQRACAKPIKGHTQTYIHEMQITLVTLLLQMFWLLQTSWHGMAFYEIQNTVWDVVLGYDVTFISIWNVNVIFVEYYFTAFNNTRNKHAYTSKLVPKAVFSISRWSKYCTLIVYISPIQFKYICCSFNSWLFVSVPL